MLITQSICIVVAVSYFMNKLQNVVTILIVGQALQLVSPTIDMRSTVNVAMTKAYRYFSFTLVVVYNTVYLILSYVTHS